MSTQKALVVTAPKEAHLIRDRPLPALRDDYILVKTVSIALNPTDWKHVEYRAPPGVLVGCDYSGIVEEVGKDVKKPFKKGDRVCGAAHGCNASHYEDGSFAEYITVKGDVQLHIPGNLNFQEAATLGIGVYTVGQGLYQSLELALPTQPSKETTPVLIYGGSTATGTLAIQFAKLSGYTVITTCSPRNFDLVKKLGADQVYDYNDPTSAAQVRESTQNGLQLAFDTISLKDSAQFCDNALSTEGGEYSALLSITIDRENVNDRVTMGYTVMGEPFSMGTTSFPSKPQDKEFAERFVLIAEKLLGEKKVQVHPIKVLPGGLDGVVSGLQLMKEGKVSGEKLVYNIADTA